MSHSSPKPQPIAVIIVRISALASILSTRAFSTLRTLPLRGSIACVARLRPLHAEPPAESPSTRYSSVFAGSRSEQSRSFPGSDSPSITPFRRVDSRAARAASRARLARSILSMITFAISTVKPSSLSLTMPATIPSTSPLPSFVFVWPSNCGWGTLTLTITVRPSRMSSPVSEASSLSFMSLVRSPYALTVAVSARRKPDRCVPPSMVRMLLQYVCSIVVYVSVYCIDTSACTT